MNRFPAQSLYLMGNAAIGRGAVKAGEQELADNPRSHSATLRVFEKG